MTTVLTAANEDAGTRLDAFLAARLPELSRSRAASLVQEGRVTVNGRPASKSCRLTGGETGPQVLANALGGAAFVLLCDLIARTLFVPYELSVGIVLAFTGTPFFLWLLLHQRKGRVHD